MDKSGGTKYNIYTHGLRPLVTNTERGQAEEAQAEHGTEELTANPRLAQRRPSEPFMNELAGSWLTGGPFSI